MKKYGMEFLRRGFAACGIGPIVLAVIYLVLLHQHDVQMLTTREVCLGILSLSVLAFMAGGMTAIYQVERLPLMAAISIHGSILYTAYLLTYLVNGWLERGIMPLLVFTGIFALSYLLIWAIIYFVIKRNTDSLNEKLQMQQKKSEEQTGI